MKDYYTLTKPGIIRGNLIASVAGFLFATQKTFDIYTFLVMLTGLALVIGSACVFNNIIDRKIDKKMKRTQNRAMALGKISILHASFYGLSLGIAGFLILWKLVNPVSSVAAMVGFFFYVVVYTYSKRITVNATLIGSISGAIPPVVGYAAVTNYIDIGAIILFLIMTVWQMPHFYSISIFRIEDYRAASIPVLSIIKGIPRTKKEIVVYIFLFLIVSILPYIFGYRGILYFIITLLLGLYWLYLAFFQRSLPSDKWAGKIFGGSLLVLSGWCGAILVDVIVNMLI